MLNVKEIATTIGDLIARCQKSRSEFLLASEAVEDTFVKQVVLDVAHQRAQIALELKAALKCFGVLPEFPSTTDSGFQIVEEEFRETLEAGNNRTILRGCILEEQRLITAFEGALEQSLPLSVQAIVRVQLSRIMEARDRIRGLVSMMTETGDL
jgi:uncharacterized protein (TIGR02284 family)